MKGLEKMPGTWALFEKYYTTHSSLPVSISPLLLKGTLLVVQHMRLVKIFMREAEGGA